VIQTEVVGTAKFIEQVTGVTPHVFRPPYGEYNQFVLKSCADGAMAMVCWSVDTNDWRSGSTPASIEAACLRQTHGGSVILMHDTHEKSVQALPEVIKDLKAKGYQFVTVSEMIAEAMAHKMAPAAPLGGGIGGVGDAEAAPVAAQPASIPLSKSGM
jgi:peptidoglycan/xylan/chitin deacetylase (PgdA/CDA1 family)